MSTTFGDPSRNQPELHWALCSLRSANTFQIPPSCHRAPPCRDLRVPLVGLMHRGMACLVTCTCSLHPVQQDTFTPVLYWDSAGPAHTARPWRPRFTADPVSLISCPHYLIPIPYSVPTTVLSPPGDPSELGSLDIETIREQGCAGQTRCHRNSQKPRSAWVGVA